MAIETNYYYIQRQNQLLSKATDEVSDEEYLVYFNWGVNVS
jgi:hypothetical protein